jgi:hypothetical protein
VGHHRQVVSVRDDENAPSFRRWGLECLGHLFKDQRSVPVCEK